MPRTKDGGFILDDSSCTPYTNMCNRIFGNALDDRELEPHKVSAQKKIKSGKLNTTKKKSKPKKNR